MMFKGKKGTSILIVGIMFFFFMTVLLTLTLSVVEEIKFKEYSGADSQKLTFAKYSSAKTKFLIERSFDIYFNSKLDNLNEFNDYLVSSGVLRKEGDYFILEKGTDKSYNLISDYFTKWYLDDAKEYSKDFLNKVGFGDLNYTLSYAEKSIVGISSSSDSLTADISGKGKLFYKPYFTVSLRPEYFEFHKFVKNFTIARNALELSCGTLAEGLIEANDDYITKVDVVTVGGLRQITFTRKYGELSFKAEFSCDSSSAPFPNPGDETPSNPGSSDGTGDTLPGTGDGGNTGGDSELPDIPYCDLADLESVVSTEVAGFVYFKPDSDNFMKGVYLYEKPSEDICEIDSCRGEYIDVGGKPLLVDFEPIEFQGVDSWVDYDLDSLYYSKQVTDEKSDCGSEPVVYSDVIYFYLRDNDVPYPQAFEDYAWNEDGYFRRITEQLN